MEKADWGFAMRLLEDCQNGGIAIGALIDQTEGEGHPAVSLLEEYCELVYQLHAALSDRQEAAANKIYRQLRKKLFRAESCFGAIPVKREIVFFPYKASMWDSLESVWRAADADPDCDAYVIPIPYYDKNADGSFGEMHYEIDQYPPDVPVLYYGDYDLEKRRPDVIYIHNPYDNINYVTSVDPQFYAKRLRAYTEKLVYIPYFILGEIDPSEQMKIEGMRHFCFLPGTIYAHQVILESETIRQIYINEYKKDAEAAGLSGEHTDRKALERKFLGTGSPKIEKLKNTRREDLKIPQEWLKIIKKPDGSWKKIVFYNISVGSLLQYNERMLRKIESVFALFKRNQNEAVLLWRPHPLIKATIESMRPKLWEAYQKIRDTYREEGWGIYDDSADLDRAVVLSDAYYGDGSSVVWLFHSIGKRALLQNPNMLNENGYSLAAAEAIAQSGGAYWYVPMWNNGLYRLDLCTCESRWIEKLGGNGNMVELYADAYSYQDTVVFVPHTAEKIAVYDVKGGKLQTFGFLLPEDEESPPVRSWFMAKIADGKLLYLLPYFYHSIVCFDIDTKEIKHIPVIDADSYQYSGGLCSYGGALRENVIYMPSELDGSVYAVELGTGGVGKLPIENKKYSSLFSVGDRLWLIPYDATETVDVYDLGEERIVRSLPFPKEMQPYAKAVSAAGKRYFQKGIEQGGVIYLLAYSGDKSVLIDTAAERIREWELPREKRETVTDYGNEYWCNLLTVEGKLCVINGYTGEWLTQTAQGSWESMKKTAKRDLSVVYPAAFARECPAAVSGTDVRDFW